MKSLIIFKAICVFIIHGILIHVWHTLFSFVVLPIHPFHMVPSFPQVSSSFCFLITCIPLPSLFYTVKIFHDLFPYSYIFKFIHCVLCVWKSEHSFENHFLYLVDSGHQNQVVRLGSKHHYLLSLANLSIDSWPQLYKIYTYTSEFLTSSSDILNISVFELSSWKVVLLEVSCYSLPIICVFCDELSHLLV